MRPAASALPGIAGFGKLAEVKPRLRYPGAICPGSDCMFIRNNRPQTVSDVFTA